jgi:hypothetical protein
LRFASSEKSLCFEMSRLFSPRSLSQLAPKRFFLAIPKLFIKSYILTCKAV